MTSSPVRGHNKGPIGPLDSDPPWPYTRDDIVTVADATRILREMGADIRRRDLEQAIAEGTGPLHIVIGSRELYLSEAIDWSQRTFRRCKELNRREATTYIRSLGYQISDSTLQLNSYGAGPKLQFGRKGGGSRSEWYTTEEWCREWVEECRALGLVPATRRREYKPLDHSKLSSYFWDLWVSERTYIKYSVRERLWRLIQYPACRPNEDTIAAYLAAWQPD
jgi:hypothetical protein